jgi:hypothetical protein
MRAVVLAAVVGCAVLGMSADTHGDEYRRKTLRGVGPFRVLVEGFHEHATQNGLSQDAIKAAVELRLRKNGIRLDDTKLQPYLYVNINVVASPDKAAYNASLSFKQSVTIVATGERCVAETWGCASCGFCSPSAVRGKALDAINELVDEFSNDYLAANEKVEARAGR